MNVNFYATLRSIAGTKTVYFPQEHDKNMTVRTLVAAIVERFPAMRSELLDSDGELYGHVHVVVNGRDFPFLAQAADTLLTEEDRVDVFPAIGGGNHS